MHISFDVWNTLLIPNPKFSAHRKEQILPAIGKTDVQYKLLKDKINNPQRSATHQALSSSDVWLELCDGNASKAAWAKTYSERQFETTLPIPVEGIEYLFLMMNRLGITYSILSNTSFVSGFMVSGALRKLYPTFQPKFEIYSDVFGYAKPHPNMAKEVLNRVTDDRIYHLGDDYDCDVIGVQPITGIQVTTGNVVSRLRTLIETGG